MHTERSVRSEQRNLFLLIYLPAQSLPLDSVYLSDQGIPVLISHTKKSTLELMKHNDVAAVLTIHHQQNDHAVQFLRFIMQQYPSIQRILLSTMVDKDLVEKAINKAHINYFLALPVNNEDLHTVVSKSFSRYLTISSPFKKINELMEFIAKFRKEAQTDTLTKLLNRRAFKSILGRALELFQTNRVQLSLVMLDLDHFKILNDTYGHMGGDKVLHTFGEILRRNTRSDDSAFRYGGEEFAIITQMDSTEKVKMFIERILHETRETVVQYNEQKIRFTCSGGIATMEMNMTRSDLIGRADAALYAAKNQGRDRVLIYDPVMSARDNEKTE